MTTLNAMFRVDENEIFSSQWEFLETPPAQAWRRMLEHSIENPKDDPLHVTEATFCASKEEAESLWQIVRGEPFVYNTPYAKMRFSRVRTIDCTGLMQKLQRLISNGMLKSLDDGYRVKEMIEHLKKVQFYLDHVDDDEFHRAGASFGQIHYVPDPKFAIAWDNSWREHLTMDITPGDVYAELHYPDMPWHELLRYSSVEQTYEPIKFKRFDQPNYMSSGFIIPMHPDLGAHECELLQFLFDNHNMIKSLDSTYDPVYAIGSCGRIPVARLTTPLGARGHPGYEQLGKIKSMFKLEVYE